MNSLELRNQYKADTGKSVFFEKEGKYIIEGLDADVLNELPKETIISMLRSLEPEIGIFFEELEHNDQSIDGGQLRIYDANYVLWLESKLMDK